MATKVICRTGDRTQTVTFTSVSYDPLDNSAVKVPQAVQALLK